MIQITKPRRKIPHVCDVTARDAVLHTCVPKAAARARIKLHGHERTSRLVKKKRVARPAMSNAARYAWMTPSPCASCIPFESMADTPTMLKKVTNGIDSSALPGG